MNRIHYRRRFLKGLFVSLRVLLSYKVFHMLFGFMPSRWKDKRIKKLHRENAALLREKAIEMKGVMIKVGQFLSSRIDFLPDEYISELSQLQDKVPPHDYEGIRAQLVAAFGKSPEEVFAAFEREPIAAASLGQVHRAVLRDGQTVAVKIQYPEIEGIIETDIRMLGMLVRIMGGGYGKYGRINLKVLHEEFSRIIRGELDYLQEGRSAERFAENFKGDGRVVFPSVIWDYTRERVLTLEFIEGVKITECNEGAPGVFDCREIASLLSEAYAKMIFIHGFFHGDPHPGNIFLQEGPKLVFVDFGMVQAIPERTKRELRRFAYAVVERNTPRIIDSLDQLGFIVEGADYGALMEVAQALVDKYRDITPAELKALTIDDIMKEIERLFDVIDYLQIPNNFILLGRTIGILNGISFQLNPEVNIIEIGKPYIKEFLRGGREEQVDQFLKDLRERIFDFWRLPSQLSEFLAKANRGELSVRMPKSELQGITGKFKAMTNIMLLVVLTVTTATTSLFFILAEVKPLAIVASAAAVVLGLLSVVRLLGE
ncbi:MAG TPA: AarF/UbiB family protein [Dissulfurispiraceae bacterium]